MPSALIHVYTGKLFKDDPSVPFYIGTLAPDCIKEREQKDLLHLRLSDDRERDLAELARKLDLSDQFQLGALLHLYTDWLWDEGPQTDHKNSYTGETWFPDYRQEINLASCYMFHHFDWAPDLWDAMDACPDALISSLDDYPVEKIRAYLAHNHGWLVEHDVGPSPAFPPDAVERFCIDAAESFGAFISKNQIKTDEAK